MNWLKKAKQGIRTWTKRDVPDGLWKKCPSCGEILYRKELLRQRSVCPKCEYHFRINASAYIDILADEGSFEETEAALSSVDPLRFRDSRKYSDRLRSAMKKTGRKSAIITGTASVSGHRTTLAVLDFSFLGGSMGSVVGEKIRRIADLAVERRLPLVIVSASGGARMQESILSLMQMAKTSAAIAAVSRARLPYISILTNPTTGGVAASFAFQGDVIIAEPRALVGFAGPRVIRETVGEELPEGFQRSEFLLEHGMIDMIKNRRELKAALGFILDSLTGSGLAGAEAEQRENGQKTITLVR